jgi:hypothetical protein
MTEAGKPKVDFLKWWLVFVTITSGLIMLFVVYVLIEDFVRLFIEYCYLVLTPLILYYSWKHKLKDEKRLALRLSVIQVIISFLFMFWCFWIYLILLGGG